MSKQYSILTLEQNESKILDKLRQNLFSRLSFLSDKDFYLAGGTALALYLGHRKSIDFDFYSKEEFNAVSLFEEIASNFPNETKSIYTDNLTLICTIDRIELSCFRYNYNLIEKAHLFKGVKIASIEDIAAMKTVAIVDRARQRDYIDLYYLLEEFGLRKILEFTKRKYPFFETLHVLQAITYFDEAEEDEERNRVATLNENITWELVKSEILKKVKDYQLSMFKKR